MARTARDTIKDKRRQIYGKIDAIDKYIHDIYMICADSAEEQVPILEQARDVTAMYRDALEMILQTL